MGETEIAHVSWQLLGQFAIGEPAASLVGMAPPRAEMHFVDRDRGRPRIGRLRSGLGPRKRIEIDDDGRCLRPYLGGKRDRVGLQRQQFSLRTDDLVFVVVASLGARHKNFPEAVAAHAHRVAAAIPVVEVADDADAPGIRREHGEAHSCHALKDHRVCAELVVKLQMVAFAKKVQVEVRQDRREAVGILDLDLAIAESRAHAIVPRGAVFQPPREQAGVVNSLQLALVPVLVDRLHLLGIG